MGENGNVNHVMKIGGAGKGRRNWGLNKKCQGPNPTVSDAIGAGLYRHLVRLYLEDPGIFR